MNEPAAQATEEICQNCWFWVVGANGLGLCLRRIDKETPWDGSCKHWSPEDAESGPLPI